VKWSMTTGADVLNFPLVLPANEQITSLTVYYDRGGGTVSFRLQARDLAGTNANLCQKDIAAGAGATSVDIGAAPTAGSLPQTTNPTHTYLLTAIAAVAGTLIYGIKVTSKRTA
jgi:hypothetical protein